MSEQTVELMLEEFATQQLATMDAYLEKRRNERPGVSAQRRLGWNWASQLGHPCDRQLTYQRLHWEQRKPASIELEYRFMEGNEKEQWLKTLLTNSGLPINHKPRSLEWPAFQISGRLDLEAALGGTLYVGEIKSIAPQFWWGTRSIKEIKYHAKFWIRKILVQLNTYLFMAGEEFGFLYLVTFGKRPRILPYMVDYDLGEATVKQAQLVNAAVDAGVLPKRIPYDNTVCEMCDFAHLCQPVKTTTYSEVPEAYAGDLIRYCDLKQAEVQEFKQLEKRLLGSKARPGFFRGQDAAYADINISTRHGETTVYRVPKDIKEDYMEKVPTTTTTIERAE